MESFERREFGLRPGGKSDAVQALLAFSDEDRRPKNQVHTIAERACFPNARTPCCGVFSALTSSKSSTIAKAMLCGVLLVGCEKSIHSNRSQLSMTRSTATPASRRRASRLASGPLRGLLPESAASGRWTCPVTAGRCPNASQSPRARRRQRQAPSLRSD